MGLRRWCARERVGDEWKVCHFVRPGLLRTHAHFCARLNSASREYTNLAMNSTGGNLVGRFTLERESSSNMAISRPKSTEFSLCQFSCMELQPIGLLPSMALVHLPVHARWWGELVVLGWARDRRDKNTFILSQ